ncbi:agamous-like MADS-box protein AGL62 [Solanum dulcamara]|uniref:agamous-like MADS-box protein AGL62 n=1 Tax=Solanum dulcamara TaxID=45834 RepID=UPI002485D0F3|nr:agamous-like MADS-box protein AGL62 [Solanum dulcamara]
MESESSNVDLALTKDKHAEDVKISKMQKSLFKKANELSILCGIQIAIIIFSTGRQPILFGKPDVESVIHQFVDANHPTAPRFYMKMKKKEEENKEKGTSIENNIRHRPSEDFESTHLESLLKLYQGLTEFEDQLIKETDLTQLN